MTNRTLLAVTVVCGAVWLGAAATAEARNLRNTLSAPVDGLQGEGAQAIKDAIRPLGDIIGIQIANQIPTLSTSAGYTYEFNPELDIYERSSKTFGPLFAERAVTLGKGKFNINASYSYVSFDTFNGHDLDDLTSRVEVAKDQTGTEAFAGLRRPDHANNFPNLNQSLIFTEVDVNLALEAQLFDFSFTYGLLEDLDVNVDVPVLRTFARSTVTQTTLDPRFQAELDKFGADSGEIIPLAPEVTRARESSVGIGDIRLRSKYLALVNPIRMAGLLDLVLPTGSPGNFQGTGDTRLGAFLIFSQTLGVLEPHLQGGVEFNCNDVDHSQAKYLAGVTAQAGSVAAFTVDFVGRSEFAAQTTIPSSARLPAVSGSGADARFVETTAPFHGRPLFMNVNRNDVLDLAVGGKLSLGPQAILFATFLLPLNNDGLRADFVPTFGFEKTF